MFGHRYEAARASSGALMSIKQSLIEQPGDTSPLLDNAIETEQPGSIVVPDRNA